MLWGCGLALVSSRWARCAPDGANLGQRFEELFLPHLNAAYSLARFIARDRAAADDIVQESFLRAFRSFATYRGGDAKTWLLTIVRNCSFDWTRSNRRAAGVDMAERESTAGHREPFGPTDLDELPDVSQDDPETSLQRQSEIAEVRAMIQRLPEPFRETLVLRELEELSYKEIAQVTGVPVGTVMSRLARARRMLTEEVEQMR
jgi:RNA polymerase sigma factor (sigma-70 family)